MREQMKIYNSPAYLPFKSEDYLMEFNNQHTADEFNTKLLLMLPMIPKRQHEKIGLNFLRLVPAENKREVDAMKVFMGGFSRFG